MRAWPMLLTAAIANGALAQGDTIYRCDDGRGGVLYVNAPCPGGRVVEIPEARPDPAARERLQRDLDAFERRQAAREAALIRARENEARKRDVEDERIRQELPQATYAPPIAYYYAPWYVPPVHRPIRPRSEPSRTRSFVPVR